MNQTSPAKENILPPSEYADKALNDAVAYITDVHADTIIAGKLVKQAVARHLDDLANAKKRQLYFDADAARRVLKFFSILRHWKGEFAKQQFILSPWQAFIVISIFGWHRADGTRRFRTVYIQVGRKNGKTTLLAGIGLYLFCADQEPGAEVYSAATKRDQARISHKDALQMVLQSPELSSRIRDFKDNLSYERNASKFEPLGANVDTTDGLNVHGAIIDELHRHKTRDLWDVIEYGSGARRQPLIVGITTSGDNADGMCYEMREHGIKVLERTIEYDSLFCYIAEPDADDDWRDEKTWPKGNPNLGISVKLDKLREDCAKAKLLPSALANFKRYRLDQWVTGSADVWMNMDLWNACEPVAAALEHRPCYGGLDLAATQDIAAFALFFPPTADDKISHAQMFFWIPKDNIPDRARQYRIPLESWVEDGWIVATPGNVIDYDYIEDTILKLGALYDIQDIGYDDWNATHIVSQLMGRDIEMTALPQTVKTYNTPMTHLGDMVARLQLNHNHNPVLRWMASNVHTASDPSGRIKPIKQESKRYHKIDGIVALLMAIERSLAGDDSGSENPYDERDLMLV